jgi:hypothetical protein
VIDGGREHVLDRLRQTLGGLARRTRRRRNRGRAPKRRQARPMQRLARVNVPDARDDALVEKRDLERGLPPAARASATASKSEDNGSGPRRLSTGCRASCVGVSSVINPNRRGSLKVTAAPDDMWITTWSCRSVSAAAGASAL